ncbi:unnamed protein product (macronuclear) [Paramecium tetraurelia]|uniref:Uncharacterized protein n=1 Tax=Paramecium tetraurelia TaxID=5888 RepID=A0E0M3_PARTE|nr:uncharacterized protein GSPATT00022008001 [Paramecium tetraurelia]CAK88840.1 unnamed protein product [Paramecium tetraurelia]|eukprot:XP_001456237.1 hypothetical protein (macronuclear) [Paramecium tetraurelia strain d4-2]
MKGEVVNLDPETNPKLKEILDLLLLAGYFRIRIPSIKPFDKILGGLSWCITQSNFAIDIQYNDDYNIGQKIKVSEQIVKSLIEMQSPYNLQPHQIQGLDLNAIYPVIKWLIKFVLETREFRQDQNYRVSKLVGKNANQALYQQDQEEKKAIQEIVSQLDLLQDNRQTKNLKKLSKKDPLRVYSTLIEYGDLSSQRTYNKFCALISGIQKQKQGNQQNVSAVNSKTQQNPTLAFQQNLFLDEVPEKKQTNQNQQVTLEQLTNLQKEKMQQAQAQIKEMSQIAGPSAEATLNEEEGRKFQKLQRRNSIAGQSLSQLISKEKIAEGLKQQTQEEDQEVVNTVNIKLQEKIILEQQFKLQQQNLNNLEKAIEQDMQEVEQLESQNNQLTEQINEEKSRLTKIVDALKVIDSKTKKANQVDIKRAEEQVAKKIELKEQKTELKKEIKQEQQKIEKEKEEALRNMPQENDQELLKEMKSQYNQKKEKFEKKFQQFQLLNQEIVVLERKLESFPQPSEIAQYHQRFLELYDSINEEMESNKKLLLKYNNLLEVKQLAAQFVDIYRTFKENYTNNLKDKKGKIELSQNLDSTYKQLQKQLQLYQEKLQQSENKRQSIMEQYRQALAIEREYYKLLKEIKFEYEKYEQYTNKNE